MTSTFMASYPKEGLPDGFTSESILNTPVQIGTLVIGKVASVLEVAAEGRFDIYITLEERYTAMIEDADSVDPPVSGLPSNNRVQPANVASGDVVGAKNSKGRLGVSGGGGVSA